MVTGAWPRTPGVWGSRSLLLAGDALGTKMASENKPGEITVGQEPADGLGHDTHPSRVLV